MGQYGGLQGNVNKGPGGCNERGPWNFKRLGALKLRHFWNAKLQAPLVWSELDGKQVEGRC